MPAADAAAEPPEEAVPAPEPPPIVSARQAAALGLPGWPRPGDPFAPPPRPVPAGRGGDQVIPRPYTAELGGPPPWRALAESRRRLRVDDVTAALATSGAPLKAAAEQEPVGDGPGATPSAVLALLYDVDDEARLVLTRRTWDLRSHQGELSFPGGRWEPGDADLVDTALRESEEEVGLDTSTVEVVGELDHLSTVVSGSFIVPYVARLSRPPELVANPAEVSAIIHVPLSELLDPAIYREERWAFPGLERSIYFFELVGDTLWGATGTMVRQLLGFATGTLARGRVPHR
ncbi:MAG: CoA pyrophosphatase [Acidimicrobiia bacterium]